MCAASRNTLAQRDCKQNSTGLSQRLRLAPVEMGIAEFVEWSSLGIRTFGGYRVPVFAFGKNSSPTPQGEASFLWYCSLKFATIPRRLQTTKQGGCNRSASKLFINPINTSIRPRMICVIDRMIFDTTQMPR